MSFAGRPRESKTRRVRRKIERRTNVVQDELRRLSVLLDDFLNLARARRLEPVRCDARSLLEEVVELRRPEIESQGVEFIEDIDIDPCELVAERDRLKQVVNNLITNAVEAVADCRQSTVQIVSRTLDDGTLGGLRDRQRPGGLAGGCRGPSSRSSPPRTPAPGLGLAIVKRIVDLHGGRASLSPFPRAAPGRRFGSRRPPSRVVADW